MRFSKIAITKAGVHLVRQTRDANGTVEEIDLSSPERPLASFTDALQAFTSYITDLLPFALDPDEMTVTTLSLSEDKNGLRGLIVTTLVPVPKAYDKPVVINTPLVREGGEQAAEDAFVLSDDVLQLIALAEDEATRYAKGERVQGELFAKREASENTKAFDERAAAAEVASTRKPKGKPKGKGRKKGRDFIPGVGDVANPEATREPSDAVLHDRLAERGVDVPVDAIAVWTSSERDAALRYADTGGMTPACVDRDGTWPLLDEWDETHAAPRVDADGVQAVQAAAESTL